MNSEIENIDDIKRLVNTFYDKVREDPLLGPVFDERIGDRWDEHLEKMYLFWQTLLLKERVYFGSPFPPHLQLPITYEHFEAWLRLFRETVRQLYSGDLAEEALVRAEKIAEVFEHKITFYRQLMDTGTADVNE